MQAIDIVWVGLGGGIGSLLRWQIGRLIDEHVSHPFKVGAFVIAYLATLLAVTWHHRYGDVISSLVLTGALGGYTTFSTMQLDAVQMAEARRHGLALMYLVTSVATGLLAAAIGVALAKA